MFFRTAGLPDTAYQAPTELRWRLIERAGKSMLVVNNPGLYHVSIADITMQAGASSEKPFDSMMIAPGEQKEFALKQPNAASSAQLSFSSINDYGARNRYFAQLSGSAEVSASLDKESP